MINAVVFDLVSGELIRSVMASDEQIEYQTVETELIQAAGTPAKTYLSHYCAPLYAGSMVVGYQILPYTTAQIAAKSARPTYPAIWSNTSMSWVDLRDVATERVNRIAFLTAERDSLIVDGLFTWDGDSYKSDMPTVGGAAIGALASIVLGTSYSVTWTKADDSTRALTASQMLALGQAQSVFVNACHQALRDAKTAIAAATTVGAIGAITLGIAQPYSP